LRPELRDIIKKFPKLRGYRFKSIHAKPAVLNIGDLEAVFSAGADVTPTALVLVKLVCRENGAIPTVKILGTGELSKAFNISGCLVSDSAKKAIEKAGGTVAPIPEKVSPQAVQNAKAARATKGVSVAGKPAPKTKK
jgi:large subunit ribosomal protein L15